MKTLNPNNRYYEMHSNNIALILSTCPLDLAEKAIQLYIETAAATSPDPRIVSNLKAPECC